MKKKMDNESAKKKIVVIGGTGLIGSKVVTKLNEQGFDAIAAAPNTGVNALTGDGHGADARAERRRAA